MGWESCLGTNEGQIFSGKNAEKGFSKSALQDRGRALVPPHLCVCALKKQVNVTPKEKRGNNRNLFLPNALTTSGRAVKWTAMRRLLADFTWKHVLYLKNWKLNLSGEIKFQVSFPGIKWNMSHRVFSIYSRLWWPSRYDTQVQVWDHNCVIWLWDKENCKRFSDLEGYFIVKHI